MILTAHQPNFMPYSGFFSKAMLADIFAITDNLQYVVREWQNRNRIRVRNGWEWLTVPVLTKNHFKKTISEICVNNKQAWRRKHWRKLLINYGSSPFFETYEKFFEKLYSQEWKNLAELNETIILYIFKELNVNAKVVRTSGQNISGQKTDFLINLCTRFGADTYLSGPGGKAYVDEGKFEDHGIRLVYQDYSPQIYGQRYEPFIPDLSVIDMMFNCGSDAAQEIIRNFSPSVNLGSLKKTRVAIEATTIAA